MKCLRCGFCCCNYWVIVVKDPAKGICEDNLVEHHGEGKPCIHLRGDKPGEYSCAIHDYRWYKKTPCFSHGQIEHSVTDPCRMGVFVLGKEKEK